MDVVRLNAWGFRARGLRPRDPTRYAIFGDPVRAPCSGRVVQALDGLPDLPPPQKDREHMAGNHVLLACGDVEVLLGHFHPLPVRLGGRYLARNARPWPLTPCAGPLREQVRAARGLAD